MAQPTPGQAEDTCLHFSSVGIPTSGPEAGGGHGGGQAAPVAAWSRYAAQVSRRPCCCFWFCVPSALAIALGAWAPKEVGMALGEQVYADGTAKRRHQAYEKALEARRGPSHAALGLAPAVPVDTEFTVVASLELYYVAKSGDALGAQEQLDIKDFEQRLRDLDGWGRLCTGSVQTQDQWLCDPGETLEAYLWPSQLPSSEAHVDHTYRWDSRGGWSLAPEVVFAYLQGSTHEEQHIRQFLPRDYVPPALGSVAPRAQALRSAFTFRLYGNASSPGTVEAAKASSREQYDSFVFEELYPFLADRSYVFIDIYFRGTEVVDHEAMEELESDLYWVAGAALLTALYLWLHVRSVLVSLAAVLVIFLSVALAYTASPADALPVSAFFATFMMLGIGSNAVFVFSDLWQQSFMTSEALEVRMEWALRRAFEIYLTVSMTTASSFLANLASPLKALRELGLFMGLCVVITFALLFLMLPSVFAYTERRRRGPKVHVKPAEAVEKRHPISPGVAVCMLRLVDAISLCPISVIAATGVTVALFVLGIGYTCQLTTEVPDVFPAWHNQVKSLEWQDVFYTLPSYGAAGYTEAPRRQASACDVHSANLTGCDFHWCDASSAHGTDACWGRAAMTLANGSEVPWELELCSDIVVRTRVAALSAPELSDWTSLWRSAVQAFSGLQDVNISLAVGVTNSSAALGLENWELGATVVQGFYDMGLAIGAGGAGGLSCEVDALCFFGPDSCDMSGWHRLGQYSLPSTRLRRLQVSNGSADVFAPNGVEVGILWGVLPPLTSPLVGRDTIHWTWDPTFDPSNPWAQRAIYATCANLPTDLAESIRASNCWIDSFRSWLYDQNLSFPSRDFNNHILQWWPTANESADNIWVVDDHVRAVRISFTGSVRDASDASEVLAYQDAWDEVTVSQTTRYSVTANRAYHTSRSWAKAEAEASMLRSTAVIVAIAAASTFVCMLLFTCDACLASFVLLFVLSALGGLMSVMFVMLGWPLGPFEALALTLFIGHSATYFFHAAHAYGEVRPDDPDFIQVASSAHALRGLANASAKFYAYSNRGQATAGDWNILREELDQVTQETRQELDQAAQETRVASDAGQELQLPPLAPPAETECGGQKTALEGPNLPPRELRTARAYVAFARVGPTTLSSAVCTVASCCVSFFSTLTVFPILAVVLIVVTTLSVALATLTLPAVLIFAGPVGSWGREKRWRAFVRAGWLRRRPSRRADARAGGPAAPLMRGVDGPGYAGGAEERNDVGDRASPSRETAARTGDEASAVPDKGAAVPPAGGAGPRPPGDADKRSGGDVGDGAGLPSRGNGARLNGQRALAADGRGVDARAGSAGEANHEGDCGLPPLQRGKAAASDTESERDDPAAASLAHLE